MTPQEIRVIEAVILALDVGRNRFGKLDPEGYASGEPLRQEAVRYAVGGAEDRVDQAVKVLRALLERGGAA